MRTTCQDKIIDAVQPSPTDDVESCAMAICCVSIPHLAVLPNYTLPRSGHQKPGRATGQTLLGRRGNSLFPTAIVYLQSASWRSGLLSERQRDSPGVPRRLDRLALRTDSTGHFHLECYDGSNYCQCRDCSCGLEWGHLREHPKQHRFVH